MREKMVTRTIVATKVTVLCADAIAGEMFDKELTLAGTFKDSKALMKAVSKAVDVDTDEDQIKAIRVKDASTYETLYGMSENDFIAAAKVLPPRGTKE